MRWSVTRGRHRTAGRIIVWEPVKDRDDKSPMVVATGNGVVVSGKFPAMNHRDIEEFIRVVQSAERAHEALRYGYTPGPVHLEQVWPGMGERTNRNANQNPRAQTVHGDARIFASSWFRSKDRDPEPHR